MSLTILIFCVTSHAQVRCSTIYSDPALLITSWLTSLNLAPLASDSGKVDQRERALIKGLDAEKLSDTGYRTAWVEKLVALKVSQKLDPLRDFETAETPERKALVRVILRSVVQHGISDYLKSFSAHPSRSVATRLMSLARMIRYSRFYQFAALWQPPIGEREILNIEQVRDILENGPPPKVLESALKGEVLTEMATERLLSRTRMITRLISIALLLNGILDSYPQIEKSIQAAKNQLQAESDKKTALFLQQVSSVADVDSAATIVDLAKSEKLIILNHYRTRLHRDPTASQIEQINKFVCKTYIETILGQNGIATCALL